MSESFGEKYVLGSELGKGGMARVFRGTMRGADSPIAVKILRSEIAEDHPETVETFLRNRNALLSVSHTNLVKVIDVIEDGDALGIVMELIEGESLRSYLRRAGELSPNVALWFFRQIMLGLSELHAMGIIHGDIKPDNILLDNSLGSPIVKIADFGLADVQQATLADGFIFGTPAYLAPEVASGTVVSSAADIYSAGIVLYEMLAGRVPFTGSPPVLSHKHRNEDPPPITELAKSQGGTWAVLNRLLAKDPTKRPSAFTVLAELEEMHLGVLEQLPEVAPASAVETASGWWETTNVSVLRKPTEADQSIVLPLHNEISLPLYDESERTDDAAVHAASAPVTFPPRHRARRLTSLKPRMRLREEEIEHEDGKLYRFDFGFNEFLLVDKIEDNETLNWTTDITPNDFINLSKNYLLDDIIDESRLTISLGGIIDEMGAEIGIALAQAAGNSFNQRCEFIRLDCGNLTLAYQMLPTSGNRRPIPVFGIKAPNLMAERVLPLLVLTATEQIIAHVLSMRSDALPSRLVAAMKGRERPA